MGNRLSYSSSPYLLQHAENPVDWYPWSDEAFEKARREDKPVFLSIGYSTCHWCHVMAHESFEDPGVAGLLNENFVAIKVDREERPDIDALYMAVAQMMTGRGGWPLTIILTPEKKPFFAGTYFPRTSAGGMTGMLDLLPAIIGVWKQKRNDLIDSAQSISDAVGNLWSDETRQDASASLPDAAFEHLSQHFDARYGGFGSAPKFPTPHNLMFLLRYWKRTGNRHALAMAEKTLTIMRSGGIYDHVGFGFHRYSTDRQWLVPHFEKMLYDQAMLSLAFCEAYQATGNALLKKTGSEILEYVLRDMQSAGGGFFSAEDADSEGEEGRFYLWKDVEIRALFTAEEYAFVRKVFSVDDYGNFVEQTTGEASPFNILHAASLPETFTTETGRTPESPAERLESVRRTLFNARSGRVRPFRDEKIMTDWNGLMIAAMAKGYQVLSDARFLQAARSARDRVLSTPLRHLHPESGEQVPAFLNDYAFLLWGLIELYEAGFDPQDLRCAVVLADTMIDLFWDSQAGGFYLSSRENEKLISATKELYDGAIPSGNSAAYLSLQRLYHLTGKPVYTEYCSKLERIFAAAGAGTPEAFTLFLCGLEFSLGTSSEIVIVHNSRNGEVADLLHRIREVFLPTMVMLLRDNSTGGGDLDSLASYTGAMKQVGGQMTIYFCRDHTCELPTTDVAGLIGSLKE